MPLLYRFPDLFNAEMMRTLKEAKVLTPTPWHSDGKLCQYWGISVICENTQHPSQHPVFSPVLGNNTPGIHHQHGLPNPCSSYGGKAQFHAEVCWKAIDSGPGLFLWTSHRLAAVDDVDVFHPDFGLLFLGLGNQIHEEGHHDHVVPAYRSAGEMSSMQFQDEISFCPYHF